MEQHFGPHSIDWMSFDSNTQADFKGCPLKHFTSFFTPLSFGVNIFAQCIARSENSYVFPPFTFIAPVVKFLFKYSRSATLPPFHFGGQCDLLMPRNSLR